MAVKQVILNPEPVDTVTIDEVNQSNIYASKSLVHKTIYKLNLVGGSPYVQRWQWLSAKDSQCCYGKGEESLRIIMEKMVIDFEFEVWEFSTFQEYGKWLEDQGE